MLVLTRAIATVLLLASCDHAERKLIGTWRAEKGGDLGEVDELEFRGDHTLVSWMCPAELSTPQTFVSSGKWRVRGKRIEIDMKQLTSPATAEHHSLQILELSKNSLVVKITDENSTVGFKRLDLPSCPTSANGSTPVAVESNIVGTLASPLSHTRVSVSLRARSHGSSRRLDFGCVRPVVERIMVSF